MKRIDLSEPHHRLLAEVTGRISNRLQAQFTDGSDVDGPNVGVELTEQGRTARIELPVDLLQTAREDQAARHQLLIRLKAKRDRLLFRAPPLGTRGMRVVATLPSQNHRFSGGGRGRR